MSIRILSSKSILTIILIVSMSSCKQEKTGYVDMFKLVNEFELQKEYSEAAKREIDMEKAGIDSVLFAEKLKNNPKIEDIKNELYAKLYQKTEKRNKEIETIIWKRLNPYLVDYGKEHGYQYIYGANGTGNVLYADTSKDITDDVIKYSNNRYHDKK